VSSITPALRVGTVRAKGLGTKVVQHGLGVAAATRCEPEYRAVTARTRITIGSIRAAPALGCSIEVAGSVFRSGDQKTGFHQYRKHRLASRSCTARFRHPHWTRSARWPPRRWRWRRPCPRPMAAGFAPASCKPRHDGATAPTSLRLRWNIQRAHEHQSPMRQRKHSKHSTIWYRPNR